MSLWAVWRAGSDGSIHVAPCDRDDNLVGGHVLRTDCFCHPTPDVNEPEMLVHHDPERGGCNA